jgi:hypothetical protein
VDVHQVVTHPTRADAVLVAAYEGFGMSRNGGDSWQFATDGMHAHYARAVAVAGERVLVSASTGRPEGDAYHKPLDGDAPFVRAEGVPWFSDNVDTGCLAADSALAAFGTTDGRVFRSMDGGALGARDEGAAGHHGGDDRLIRRVTAREPARACASSGRPSSDRAPGR